MSEVQSTMLPLGTQAPAFELKDVVSGKKVSLNDFEEKDALLVIFICVHCPYVQHIKYELAKLGNEYLKKNVGVITINSNDIKNYPEDAPKYMKEMADELSFQFPFLFDETQEIAKKYTAACTPDFFLFNENKKLVYRGQLDNARPGNNNEINGMDLRNATEAVLKNKEVSNTQKPSSGCNIKWKAGNEPSYF